MKKNAIISLADSKYFELLSELHSSLVYNNILNDYDFGVLDTGLTENEINLLLKKNVIIHKAEWNAKVLRYKVRNRDHLKTQFARAFLPDYFNGYNIYIAFIIQRDDCNKFSIASDIDAKYSELLTIGIKNNLKILCYDCKFSSKGIKLNKKINFINNEK